MNFARARQRALLPLALCVLAVTSCRSTSEPNANETPKNDTIVSTTPPFKTREPERYSATRTITIFPPNGEPVISKTRIARDGPRRREEPQTAKVAVVYLDLPEGRFLLYPEDKVYAAATAEDQTSSDAEAEDNSPDLLLNTEPISTTYQLLGSEILAGHKATKYRIVVNKPAAENVSQGETLMWIDDSLNMPIKSETKSLDGTRTVTELSDVTLDADKQLFQIPDGYLKIVFSTLQKQLQARGLNPSVR